MKKSDLLDITLRIFGIYFLVIVLNDIKQFVLLFGSVYYQFPWTSYEEFSAFNIYWPYILNFLIDLLFVWIFLVKPQVIRVRILGPKRDSDIDLRIDKRALMQIAVIVIGGLLMITSLEYAGNFVINIAQTMKMHMEPDPYMIPELIWYLILGIAGYAIITASGAIARYLTRDEKIAEPVQPPAISPRAQWRIPTVKWHRRRPFKHRKKT